MGKRYRRKARMHAAATVLHETIGGRDFYAELHRARYGRLPRPAECFRAPREYDARSHRSFRHHDQGDPS